MTKSDILNYTREHYQEFYNQYNVEIIGLFLEAMQEIKLLKIII